jgi:hypothetical protein
MATDAKHTPAPWRVEEGEITAADGQTVIGQLYGADDFPCLDDVDRDGVDEESHANARLIAAAPDLLRACEMLVAAQDGGDVGDVLKAMDAARAAVAKATGG